MIILFQCVCHLKIVRDFAIILFVYCESFIQFFKKKKYQTI